MRDFLSANVKHTNRDKGLSDSAMAEKVREKLENVTESFRAATAYAPYTEEVTVIEWIPTKTKLEAAITAAGGGTFPVSMAKSRVSEWVFGIPLDAPAALRELGHLLASAAHQFKSRKGPEYDDLVKFCDELTGGPIRKSEWSGDELNLASPVQMHHLLYGKLALPIRHRITPQRDSVRTLLGFGGAPAGNDLAIEYALAEDCQEGDWRREVLMLVRTIKSIQTRFSLIYNPYPLWVRPDTGRVHGQIRNCGTVTRRPTGTSPNKLQVAKGEIRQIYTAYQDEGEEHVLVAFDFSQQELRILADVSGDPTLLDAYLGSPEKDVHSLTGAGIAGPILKRNWPELKAPGQVSYEAFQAMLVSEDHAEQEAAKFIRNKRAKGTVFGFAYETSASSVSTRLLMPMKDAEDLLNGLAKTYPRVLEFHAEAHAHAEKWGYTKTAYGSRRHMSDDILSGERGLQSRAGRQASNAMIQACAADILKVVIAKCMRAKLFERHGAYLVITIYDEILSSVPVSKAVSFCQELKPIMEVTPPGHKVSMVAEGSIGVDWWRQVDFGRDVSEKAILSALGESREWKKGA